MSIERLRAQLYSLERALRAVRAEVEMSIVSNAIDSEPIQKEVNIGSGLESFLTGAHAIRDAEVEPYKAFAPDVWCSYSPDKTGNQVSVSGVSLESVANETGNALESTCLVVRPKIDPKDPTGWLTVETNLETKALKKVKQLRISFLPCFRYASGKTLSNMKLHMRVYEGERFSDYPIRTFPSVGVPLEMTFTVDQTTVADIQSRSVTQVVFIIGLPIEVETKYEFMLSNFSVTGIY